MTRLHPVCFVAFASFFLVAGVAQSQERGRESRRMLHGSISPQWAGEERLFWYATDSKEGGQRYVAVDLKSGQKFESDDVASLRAQLLEKAEESDVELRELLERDPFQLVSQGQSAPGRTVETGDDTAIRFINRREEAVELFWIDTSGRATGYGSVPPGATREQHTFAGHMWMVADSNGNPIAYFRGEGDLKTATVTADMKPIAKEHGQPRRAGRSRNRTESTGGGWKIEIESESAEVASVYRVESSPRDGGRAKLLTESYLLPGEPMSRFRLKVVEAASSKSFIPVEEWFDFGPPRYRWVDENQFVIEKVDRGHQRFRLFRVDASSNKVETILDETTDTFIWTNHGPPVAITTYLDQTPEMIYSSEKDGWRHLYLVKLDGESGASGVSCTPITSGEYVVRSIERIDEEKRQIWFQASGREPGQDPYLLHHYRIDFDGTNLVSLSPGNGQHTLQFSPTRAYYVDSYSRVDQAPIHELRKAADGSLVCELEKADVSGLIDSGWQAPEVFSGKGRDGVTDIWGFICKPRNFDPAKKYPIIESIYAGPHDSHVPKSFQSSDWFKSLTELGFIVVKIDGMGTANRSKAFHDVCWHNLKDAGFPDRIAWMRAAAETRPWMDIERVGIYGTSAGGQNAAGALIFHGDFYKAAAAFCGCHDNRMDKASWNEQWMGYPVGPHYSKSSNIDHADTLQGHLFLMVGELDSNVPPESTLRFADALIRADKDFEMLVMPGVGHSDGGGYGQRRMRDFFVRHLITEANTDSERIERDKVEKGVGLSKRPKRTPRPATDSSTQEEERSEASDDPADAPTAALVKRFKEDLGSLNRFYSVSFSPTRIARLERFYSGWLGAIESVDAASLSDAEQLALTRLGEEITTEQKKLEGSRRSLVNVESRSGFVLDLVALVEARQRVDDIEPIKLAGECDKIAISIRESYETLRDESKSTGLTATQWQSLTRSMKEVRDAFREWHGFYDQYDPLFSWWVAVPFQDVMKELDMYVDYLEQMSEKSRADAGKESDSVDEVASDTLANTSIDAAGAAEGNDAESLPAADVVDLAEVLRYTPGEVAGIIRDYEKKLRAIHGHDREGDSDEKLQARRGLYEETLALLDQVAFEEAPRHDQVDWILLKNEITYRTAQLNGTQAGPVEALAQDASGLSGTPVGRELLEAELVSAFIDQTPDVLVRIAEREYEWCREELLKASREMGLGDDWKAAVEKVKTMHVAPGGQPALIRELARESIEELERGELVSIPPIASETYRMEMMAPERQLVNPFFTGGEVISVSFPASTMKHQDKLQSMRGNNRMFSRATVHHELIPGHHLQGFMTDRFYPHRKMFYTPFWGEGWAVYWEMLLYQRGFARTPEERIGFLVWRAHRCARIIFSLNYHLGRMTPLECVDFLVENVGFDRNNATAEVRRSIGTDYSPLYQAGYMLGALQFRKLREELVDSGTMTEREYHDAVLRQNYMPIGLLRAVLRNDPLSRDFRSQWDFYPQLDR